MPSKNETTSPTAIFFLEIAPLERTGFTNSTTNNTTIATATILFSNDSLTETVSCAPRKGPASATKLNGTANEKSIFLRRQYSTDAMALISQADRIFVPMALQVFNPQNKSAGNVTTE